MSVAGTSDQAARTEMPRLSNLVQDLEDGVIEPGDREFLMEMLRTSGSAREFYIKQVKLAALLRETAETRGELGTIPVSQEMLKRARRSSAWSAIGWGVAAVLVITLGLTLFQVGFGTGDQESAWNVSDDARCRIQGDDAGEPRGKNRLRTGDRIVLERGLLQLEFPSGVEALIEAPSKLEMVSDSEIRLDGGMAWFRVPESGKGFAVETAIARVIDLGTEFGLCFVGGEHLQIHVGKGRVRVEPESLGSPEFEISAGKAIRLGGDGKTHEVTLQPEFFRRKFTRRVPYLHWTFDHLFENSFPAAGIISGVPDFGAELKAAGDAEISARERADSQTDGVRGRAFSMNGNVFAESSFSGIAGNAPRTVAAWVRHRGSPELFPSPGAHDSRDDPYPGFGATTPFGEQAFLLNYGNTGITTAEGTIDESLEPNTTYELDFHVAARPGVHSATYRVELVAFGSGMDDEARRDHSKDRPGTVLAYAEGEAVAHDMSEQDRISFSAGADHPALGEKIAIRLVHRGELVQSEGRTRHSGRVLYDDLKLSKQQNGKSQLVFSEGFESPRVAGYAATSLPDTGWVGLGSGRGLFNHHPPYRTPYVSWGKKEEGRLWAGFVEDLAQPAPGTATGNSWLRGKPSRKVEKGRWVHLAAVYTGGLTSDNRPEIIQYIDGERVESHPASPAFTGTLDTAAGSDGAAPLRFGALSGDTPVRATWNGDIDECFIFRGALDDDEIGRLMEYHSPHFLKK